MPKKDESIDDDLTEDDENEITAKDEVELREEKHEDDQITEEKEEADYELAEEEHEVELTEQIEWRNLFSPWNYYF